MPNGERERAIDAIVDEPAAWCSCGAGVGANAIRCVDCTFLLQDEVRRLRAAVPVGGDGLVAAGDQLQSAASRMAEWITATTEDGDIDAEVPYEVACAAGEARSAADAWTAARLRRMLTGVELIAAERRRQIEREGWTPEHDDMHLDGALRKAAITYATFPGSGRPGAWGHEQGEPYCPSPWPFELAAWKPSEDPVRDLVRAGALIAAEIDRLRRAASTTKGGAEHAS